MPYDPKEHSRVYKSRVVDDELAEEISEQYFLCERDRYRMGQALGHGRILDDLYLHHPLVRRKIVAKAREMVEAKLYTRERHVQKLQEIRDGAIRDENWKEALKAEVAVGTAAGLYEKLGDSTSSAAALPPPEDLSTEQIRARLSQIQQPQLPSPDPEISRGSRVPSNTRPMDDDDRPF